MVTKSYKIQRNLTIELENCNLDEIVTAQGTCQLCEGPDFYIPSNVQECIPCKSDVFTCNGGDQIDANTGYQRLLQTKDVFAKCDKLGGQEVCLANNTCMNGYEGFMCK